MSQLFSLSVGLKNPDLYYTRVYKVGSNAASNRLSILNTKSELTWVNESVAVKCKNNFLKNKTGLHTSTVAHWYVICLVLGRSRVQISVHASELSLDGIFKLCS